MKHGRRVGVGVHLWAVASLVVVGCGSNDGDIAGPTSVPIFTSNPAPSGDVHTGYEYGGDYWTPSPTSSVLDAATSTATPSTSSPDVIEERQVMAFTGDSGQESPQFTVAGRWEIKWNAKGERFAIHVYEGDELRTVAADVNGPGSGSSVQPKGGTYRLKVSAVGEWFVRVKQLAG